MKRLTAAVLALACLGCATTSEKFWRRAAIAASVADAAVTEVGLANGASEANPLVPQFRGGPTLYVGATIVLCDYGIKRMHSRKDRTLTWQMMALVRLAAVAWNLHVLDQRSGHEAVR